MTHDTLIKLICAAHVAIFVSAFTILINFSSFSSGFRSWRGDIEEILKNSKRTLAVNLGEKLKAILENAAGTTTSIILYDDYCETPVSPTEGENYHNTLFDFINDKAHEMAHYRSLLLIHKAYSFWVIYLSCTTLILMVVELLLVALIGYYGILKGETISNLRIVISFIISGIGIVFSFVGLVFLFINHNKGINGRGCND